MRGVQAALEWFFSLVDEGIILEDDCLPHIDFFTYAAELLDRYRNDTRIMTISGDRSPLGPATQFHGYSYGFSRTPLIWGWATWKRAWKTFEIDLQSWAEVRDAGWLKGIFNNEDCYNSFWDMFNHVHIGRSQHTWDYQWLYNCVMHSGLTIVPSVNLITNIGFDDDSTHTTDPDNQRANYPLEAIEWPLIHPSTIHPWGEIDSQVMAGAGLRRKSILRKIVKRFLPPKDGRIPYYKIPG